jgi:putative PEP-CTERM system TPR-repeat lipoprotein
MNKREFYRNGLEFLEKGNSRGAIIAFKRAIEKDQNFFEARYQLALSYIMNNKYDSAQKELFKVLRLNPSFNDAHVSLAKVHLKTGKIDDALKEIELYLQKNNNNPEAYELAASAHAAKKDYIKTEEILEKTIEKFPERISARIILSKIYLAGGKMSQAEAVAGDILGSEPENMEALYLLARVKREKDNLNDLLNTYKRILEINPDDATVLLQSGLIYLEKGDLEKARETGKGLVKSHPKRPEGTYLMGLISYHEKEIDEAVVFLQKSAKKGSHIGVHYYLGLCYFLKGSLEQATNEFQRVVDQRPDVIQGRLLLAVTHLRKGRPQDAEEETKKVLKMDEKNAFAHNLLGSAYMALGKGEAAVNEFDRAIELNPRLIDAHIKKGAFNLLSGNAGKAEQEFVDAVEIAPDLLNSRIVLARYYIKIRRYKDAVKTLEEGLRGNPQDALLYNMIGMVYLRSGDMDKASENFERSIDVNPGFYLPYSNLAFIYMKRNEKEKAMAEYKKYLDLDKDNAAANVMAMVMTANILETDNKDNEALQYYMKARRHKEAIAFLSLAEYYLRKKNDKKTIEVIDEGLSIFPRDTKLLDMKGMLYVEKRKFKEALSVYRDLKKISLETGMKKMAAVYETMGDYKNAIRELNALLAAESDRVDVLVLLTELYISKKDYKEAEKTANRIITLVPESYIGYKTLSAVYSAGKQYGKALDNLKKANEKNPDNPEIKIEIARTYESLNEPETAMEILEDIETSNSGHVPAYFFQSVIMEKTGEKEAAVEKHKRVLELSPDYIPSLNNLAYLYADGYGPIEEALKMAQKAKELAPGNGSVTDTLGWVLYKNADYSGALKQFIEATYYLPGEPAIRYHLGLAYIKKGMDVKAEEQLKNAVRLARKSSFPELEETKKLLEGFER